MATGEIAVSRGLVPVLVLVACSREPVPRGDLPDEPYASDRPDVEIRVVDAAGDPIEGAWVTLSPSGRDASTDGAGEALLAGVVPGPFDLLVAADGFGEATVPIEVGDAGLSLDVALEAADVSARIVGTVVDPYGQPVRNVLVQVDGADAGTTAADGTYEIAGLAPGPHELRFDPGVARLADRDVAQVTLVEAGAVTVDVALAGHPTPSAQYIGSTACLMCHGGGSDPGGKWFDSAHAKASQAPSAWADTDLEAAFAGGAVIGLGPDVPAGTVTLAETGPGQWTADVSDGAASTGPMPVIEVYGGHRAGAALAVELDGTLMILPALWALPGQGLSSQQDPAAFVPAYTEGWFDAGALEPGPEASFDLQCAGCHATGHALDESSGAWSLVSITTHGALERRVGCEACHGPGSEHAGRPDIARLTIWQPARAAPADRLDTCARCHERVTADDHPFSADPGWPVDPSGVSLRADATLSDFATADPTWWAAVPASRTYADQVGELRASPHRQGPDGYDGACEDCHDPHGSDRPAGLRVDPWDNALCTTCHVTKFPNLTAQRDHAAHSTFAPGPWGAGTCTGCHLARSGRDVRLDAVSTVGELHSHALVSFDPDDILVEFDLAGEDHLPAGDVPVIGCLDCHLQVHAERQDEGDVCVCALGDPLYRVTYENLGRYIDAVWGTP